jgi:GNAT superfamily N-acetyltransferase
MADLDRDSLALKMNSLQRGLDGGDGASTEVVRYFDHAFATVSVDPTSTARAASFNRNHIRLCGGRGLSTIELNEIAQMFDAQGVECFFVWLSPGPGIKTVREWLTALGAVKVPWTEYPTMVHTGKVPPTSASAVEVRKITREDIDAGVLAPVVDALMDSYTQSVGRSGYRHFAAFEGSQPIGGAVLIQFEDIGYLTCARTAEAFRRRGSHTALIAARIDEARRLGCTLILTETLTMLKDSYANLTRAGFQVAYEKEVYECVRSSAPQWQPSRLH